MPIFRLLIKYLIQPSTLPYCIFIKHLSGYLQDANDNGLPSKIINPSTLRIEIDTVPGEVTSAIQYLTGGSWSKILSQASSKKPSGRKTPFIGATEDLKRHEICGPPYDYRPLRPQIASSTDILDGVSESIPAILEASYILDSSIPPALRGKAGRQGMISLQKTLAILASRQLALPLGKLSPPSFCFFSFGTI